MKGLLALISSLPVSADMKKSSKVTQLSGKFTADWRDMRNLKAERDFFKKKRTTKNRHSTDFSDQERIIFSLLSLAVIHYAMKTLCLSQSHLLTMASSGAFLRPANRASLLKFSAEHCGHPTFFVSFLSVFPLLCCKAI